MSTSLSVFLAQELSTTRATIRAIQGGVLQQALDNADDVDNGTSLAGKIAPASELGFHLSREQQLEAAIKAGEGYPRCACGKRIPRGRWRSLPGVPTCVKCQRKREKGSR